MNMQKLSVQDLVDAFTGAKDAARDAMPTRDQMREQMLNALGGKSTDDAMMGSFGIFAAGIVLGAGLAVLFAPKPGSEIREAISEKISNLRPAAEG
jgi:hypothetical protein